MGVSHLDQPPILRAKQPAAGGVSPAALVLDSESDAQARFADLLGQNSKLPAGVLHRALVDQRFAHQLLVSRNAPKLLDALINDPRNDRYAEEAAPSPSDPTSKVKMLGKAAMALAKWGATGFTHTDEEEQKARLAACGACPHAKDSQDLSLARMFGGKSTQSCGLCGCPIARKAMMSTETCPGEDPDNPGFNRWGKAIADAG